MLKKNPVVLLILDGWGYREDQEYNAIALAHTPQWNEWWESCPHIMLDASGHEVGLPDAQMGNSEVGHMHIGAGRRIPQDFTRINEAIADGSFSQNHVFNSVIEEMKTTSRTLHVLGLLSPGGVHSHENHLFEFLSLCAAHNFHNVCLHLFLDGRDTPPQSAGLSIERLQHCLARYPVAQIGSISGRYYAMDRDNRWDRIQAVFQLLTENKSDHHFATPEEALQFFYKKRCFDEFIPPTRIGAGKAIENGDAIFFFNFRADRARQLSHAFLDEDFTDFNRATHPKIARFISMTRYRYNLATEIAFPPVALNNTLGEVLATHNLKQLRLAETEKYAHVTFFLNGGTEEIYPQEGRQLIPSPNVATYDLKPEMSAPELTQALTAAIESQEYDVIICNYANADMVGHTGNLAATIQAIECLDDCMKAIGKSLENTGGHMLITADHGNAELMYDESAKQVQTAHTNLPVPLLLVGGGWHFNTNKGSLIDLAPSILKLLNIKTPKEMTGKNLLVKNNEASH